MIPWPDWSREEWQRRLADAPSDPAALDAMAVGTMLGPWTRTLTGWSCGDRHVVSELLAAEWDEDQHPRDERGKFTETESDRPTAPDTPAFKAWFKDSAVVDEHDQPLVVYHGTQWDIQRFFPGEVFDPDTLEEGAIYFTDSASDASEFAENMYRTEGQPNIVPVYLAMREPMVVDWKGEMFEPDTLNRQIEMARAGGYDGLIADNIVNFEGGEASTTYVVFKSTQVKSAIGNKGTFDPKNPDISAAEWEEEKHPRDDHGRFSETEGREAPTGDLASPRSSADIRAKRYFHGVDDPTKAEAILSSGLLHPGAERQGRGYQDPIAGRTYLTPSQSFAAIYALGGVLMGEDPTDPQLAHKVEQRYGYIFEVAGEDLIDPQPDEDEVGEYVSLLSPRMTRADLDKFWGPEVYPKLQRIAWLRPLAERVLSSRRLGRVDYGEAADQSAAGKTLLKHLTPHQKLELIRATKEHNVATAGPIRVRAAWRLDKMRMQELKPDGSNLFEIAERVPLPRQTGPR